MMAYGYDVQYSNHQIDRIVYCLTLLRTVLSIICIVSVVSYHSFAPISPLTIHLTIPRSCTSWIPQKVQLQLHRHKVCLYHRVTTSKV